MTISNTVSNIVRGSEVQGFNLPLTRRSTTTSEDTPILPSPTQVHSTEDLLDPDQLKAVRKESTQAQQQSNFWFEISRVALWTTTAMIGLTAMALAGASWMAGVSFLIPLAGAIASSVVLIKSSQHSKRILTDRMFDVEDFRMQRQAALVAQSVEQAVAPAPGQSGHWQQRVSHSAVSLDQAR